MELKKDTDVYTADGDHLGQIDRIVIDPRSKEVTHVVIRKGFFFTEDKVIPMDRISRATEDKVSLRPDVHDLDELEDFEETHYVAVNEEELARGAGTTVGYAPAGYAPNLYWYPATISFGGYYPPAGYPTYVEPGYTTETERNIPEGTIPLKEGAKVIAADDEHVGNIDEVVTDSRTDQITHFVISQGLLFKEKKQIPSTWIDRVGEDEVYLAVGSRVLEDLKPYHS